MTKREDLYDQCRRLYVVHGLSRRTIAQRMGVSERSLQTWATDNKDGKGSWDEQKAGIMDGEAALYTELLGLAAVATRQLKDDMLDGRLDPKQVANVEKLVKSALKALEAHRKSPPDHQEALTKDQMREKLQGNLRRTLGLAGG